MQSRRGYMCGGTHICVGVAGDMCAGKHMYNGGTHIRATPAYNEVYESFRNVTSHGMGHWVRLN